MEGVDQQRAKRTSKPFVSRNVETDFFALQNRRGKLVLHQFLEDEFLLTAPDFKRSRKFRGIFDDAVIEKRGPHLDGMGHAHAVALG